MDALQQLAAEEWPKGFYLKLAITHGDGPEAEALCELRPVPFSLEPITWVSADGYKFTLSIDKQAPFP